MRGKPISDTPSSRIWGITPAGAGKTYNFVAWSIQLWDHPRRCGENEIALLVGRGSPGSPPQVRGKPNCGQCITWWLRITPAGAGKTFTAMIADYSTQDHPRRCGENQGRWGWRCRSIGSPPQVRGKRKNRLIWKTAERITPAGAGKTIPQLVDAGMQLGSPPQVRGKLNPATIEWAESGITPAGAGKTTITLTKLLI